MKVIQNYIKYYGDKVNVSVNPSLIPYEGGKITVLYSFDEIKEFTNGYKTKSFMTRVKTINIPSRTDDKSKYGNNLLQGEFYDAEIDRVIFWDGIIQEGKILPQLAINIKDSHLLGDIKLKVKSSDNTTPSNVVWEHKLIKNNTELPYDVVIKDNILSFNNEFSGIILLTAKADDYISTSKLISVNYNKNAKLNFSVSKIKQSVYELQYNEKEFTISFDGKTEIILDDEVLSSTVENVSTAIYLPSENLSSDYKDINSDYIWNGERVHYQVRQHGAKECNGIIEYQIMSISPSTSDDYISWNESVVEVKYMTNIKEYCYDGSSRETIENKEQIIEVGTNNTGLDIMRSGEIKWETTSASWQCIQTANPNMILAGSSSEVGNINDGFEIPYNASAITINYTGVTHNYYMNNKTEDKFIETSTTVDVSENTSSEKKLINGTIMWGNSVKNWEIVQLPNPKKVISTQYDIEIVYPQSTDTIPWSAETLEIIYNTIQIDTCLDNSTTESRDTKKDTKTIEKNNEIVDVQLNGTIVWNNSMAGWSCIQLPNQEIIFDRAEYLITDIKDSFTVPSTATSATITYNAVSRMYFKDGHYNDNIKPKSKNITFDENMSTEKREIKTTLKWNNVEYECVIYQRGKRKQSTAE